MPLYEDLVRRAVEAQERASVLVRDSGRLAGLAQALRDAYAGRSMLVRCAWCESLQIGDEWLRLEAIGEGQQRITERVRVTASHGICPTCFEAEMRFADEQRSMSRLADEQPSPS